MLVHISVLDVKSTETICCVLCWIYKFAFCQHFIHIITIPPTPHLGAAHADDAVDVTVGIVEEGHGDGMFAGGDPIPLGGGVNLENMGPGTEDRLLPGGGNTGTMRRRWVQENSFCIKKMVQTLSQSVTTGF